ncbi:MAG: transposase [Prevotellaceae bacterium]|jgi:GTP-binding protein EngB required for normal cell division|nr:transposase [Prevotellaceae bacterium]
MCVFHQYKIVERYLTKRPELSAAKELLDIVKLLAHTDKESFIGMFEEWENRWNLFLKERKKDKNGKSYYVHKRLRSACLSIRRNMPFLWTWYDNIELCIPNTNNGLEGQFTDLKSKLRNHNGLSKVHRKTFIEAYLNNH